MTNPITVIGDPASAWLTACALARFLAEPDSITVVETAPAAPLQWVLRPDMEKLHRSLGLDIRQIPGGEPVGVYEVLGREIPLSPFGAPLQGVAFQHVWVRAAEAGETHSLWAFNAKSSSAGLCRVGTASYASALERIARGAGVKDGVEVDPEHLIINAGSSPEADAAKGAGIALSQNDFSAPATASLAAHRLHLGLKALIKCGLGDTSVDPQRLALTRRLSSFDDHFDTFIALLGPHPDTSSHRAQSWRDLGRVIPVDDDPFTAAEWIAALLHAGVTPQNYHSLSLRFSRDELMGHMDACAARSPLNV
ncbi:MAG: hypothetical protein AAFX86_00065 [Pseudomonadota bacterium]